MLERPRRNRRSESLRKMLQETQLSQRQLVLPLFVKEGDKLREEIPAIPGSYRLSIDEALREAEKAAESGILGIALFPVVPNEKKDARASESKNPKGIAPDSIRAIKKRFPELVLFADVAMDPYSSDGHDGLVHEGRVVNDPTLPILCEQALCLAQAGVDFVAPSDMMDGRIEAIRSHLDSQGFSETGILSYTAKYASSLYGPFRQALDSAPRFGDKKTYQMNPANRIEALREARLDIQEGADILMVKPALSYLDIISDLHHHCDVPIAAYQVSGEFAMIHAAARMGWIDLDRALQESLLSIRRAGAQIIFTYAALSVKAN
ncbi:MAG: porphobilinogen synthase [Bdellovibrionales bacterium]|nr:porphobilinogen synthase [Bdellovibrionales bacterium]